MAHADRLGLAALVTVLATSASACWDERDPCTHWAGKLARGEEAAVAVTQLAGQRCVAARSVLLGRLDDAGLGADVLRALVVLGRSPEAEEAVRRSLTRPETVAEAARRAGEWKLAAAEPELRAALADPALAAHHETILAALLTVAPPERSLTSLAAELADAGPTMERALAALANVDWATAAAPERTAVARALAELASRPGAPPARTAAALHALGRLRAGDRTTIVAGDAVVTRAKGGDRAALLALWCLGTAAEGATASLAGSASRDVASLAGSASRDVASLDGSASRDVASLDGDGLVALAQSLVDAPGTGRATRALAAAIDHRQGGPTPERVARAAADDDGVLALALAGGAPLAPALTERVEREKGAARAAFARALGVVLPPDRLAGWQADLGASPSQLLRAIPHEPAVAAATALAARCGSDEACHRDALTQALPALAKLDADVQAARRERDAAAAEAQAAVAADVARAQELARVSGEGLAAARAELERIAARRDTLFAPVRALDERLARLDGVGLAVIVSLARLAPERARDLAEAVLVACRGDACGAVRGWAAVALIERARACLLEGEPTEAP